ncbi:MAG: hypothetical protein K8S87_03570 [Planctomycetes bacterium]|nr:hypothetical protein [Planctomycetota bacterium]
MAQNNIERFDENDATFLAHSMNPADAPPQTDIKPYDLTSELEKVIARLATLEEFGHIKLTGIILSLTQCRKNSFHGVYAAVKPMRFESGKREKTRGKYRYIWPKFVIDGYLKLYQMIFYIPRFLDIKFDDKLLTIIHEMYHISPRFNGDLRRFSGKNYAHGHSREEFDKALIPIINKAKKSFDLEQFDFMMLNFKQIREKYGSIVGNMFRNLEPERYPK